MGFLWIDIFISLGWDSLVTLSSIRKRLKTVVRNLLGSDGGGNSTVHVSPCISSSVNGPSHLTFPGRYTSTCESIGALFMSDLSGPFRSRTAALTCFFDKCRDISYVALRTAMELWKALGVGLSVGIPSRGSAPYTSKVGTSPSGPTESFTDLLRLGACLFQTYQGPQPVWSWKRVTLESGSVRRMTFS